MKLNLKVIVPCAAASIMGAAAWWGNSTDSAPTVAQAATPVIAVETPSVQLTPQILDTPPGPQVSGLRDFDPNRLVAEIANTHDPVVLALVADLISASDPTAQGIAADALARHGGYDAIANLLRVAGLQEGTEARAVVLDGLNALSDAEGFATLASTLAATRDPQFIDAVVTQLARSSDPSVLTTLVDLYRERNDAPFQKNQVLRAIASLHHPDLARALGKLANTASEPALVAAADSALQRP
jgi:hypothetical protein